MFSPTCLNVAIRLKVADVLLNKPDGLHISELASKVNTDENKLGRILRLLATRHVFREGVCQQSAETNPESNLLQSFERYLCQQSIEYATAFLKPPLGPWPSFVSIAVSLMSVNAISCHL